MNNKHVTNRLQQQPHVFQITPPICKVTLQCISDHLDVTRFMKYKDKVDYFYSNGVDYDNVNKYYYTILKLNNMVLDDNDKKDHYQ